MRPAAFLACFVLSCAAPLPPTTTETASPDPGGASVPSTPPAEVSPPAGTGTTTTTPAEEPKAQRPTDMPADCFGKALDLSALIARNACRADPEGRAPPVGALAWATAPANVTLASAGSSTIRVTGTNVSKKVVTFDFALNCDPARGFRAKATAQSKTFLLPAGEEAIVGWSNWCDQTARCARPLVRIALPPGGQVFMPLEVHARERGLDAACKKTQSALLRPGKYELTFDVPLYEQLSTATGALEITR